MTACRRTVLVKVSTRSDSRQRTTAKLNDFEGIQKTTLWLRIFFDLIKNVGYAGTWGPGANAVNNIHVKDCVMGLLLVLQAALEGRADEGPEGLCKRDQFCVDLSIDICDLQTLRQAWSLKSHTMIGPRSWAT